MVPAMRQKSILQRKNYLGDIIFLIQIPLLIVGVAVQSPGMICASGLIAVFHNIAYGLLEPLRRVIWTLFHLAFFLFLFGRIFVDVIFGVNLRGLFGLELQDYIVYRIFIVLCLALWGQFLVYFGLTRKPRERNFYVLVGGFTDFIERIFGTPFRYILKPFRALINWIKQLIGKVGDRFDRLLYRIAPRKNADVAEFKQLTGRRDRFHFRVRIVALIVYAISMPLHLYKVISQIEYVAKVGYHGSYLEFNPLPRIFTVISGFFMVAYVTYLMTRPSRRGVLLVSVPYLFSLVLLLKAGQRFDISLNLLMLVCYFTLREADERRDSVSTDPRVRMLADPRGYWISRGKVIVLIVIAVVGVVVLSIVEFTRRGSSAGNRSIPDLLTGFLITQGISAKILGYAISYKNFYPQLRWFTLGPVLEFVRFTVIGNWFMGQPVPTGQSIERALDGHLFSQALAYFVFPNRYLKGYGVGSGYIAELYVDFSYVGVFIGAMVYGLLIYALGKMFSSRKLFQGVFMMFMLQGFFFAPRASFSVFLTKAFTPRLVIGFFLIMLVARVWDRFDAAKGKPL